MKRYLSALAVMATLAAATPALADTLLVDRAREKPAGALPVRGQSMQQVQAQFGAPSEQLQPRGGQKRQWPTINRWVYPQFTVYFEKQKVIDVVANQAYGHVLGAGIAKGRIAAMDTARARAAPGVIAIVTAENAGETLFVRCERQGLRKLPETGAIVFTIGV